MVFACESDSVVGVLHSPQATARTVGVVVVVGGPQIRTGSHRQFVQLARAVAAQGYPVLRFDVRGMGDSSGRQRTFEEITPDISAAISELMAAHPQLHGVVLWGLCDGASAALLYWHDTADARIQGLCLLNPWVRSQSSLARTHVKHYYLRRIFQRSFWQKFILGGVRLQAARSLVSNILAARARRGKYEPIGYQTRMASAWSGFSNPILLILSSEDYTAREFETHVAAAPDWRGLLGKSNVILNRIKGADHTFSDQPARLKVEAALVHWLSHFRDAEAFE